MVLSEPSAGSFNRTGALFAGTTSFFFAVRLLPLEKLQASSVKT
jgi:hypothetical protein